MVSAQNGWLLFLPAAVQERPMWWVVCPNLPAAVQERPMWWVVCLNLVCIVWLAEIACGSYVQLFSCLVWVLLYPRLLEKREYYELNSNLVVKNDNKYARSDLERLIIIFTIWSFQWVNLIGHNKNLSTSCMHIHQTHFLLFAPPFLYIYSRSL